MSSNAGWTVAPGAVGQLRCANSHYRASRGGGGGVGGGGKGGGWMWVRFFAFTLTTLLWYIPGVLHDMQMTW